MCFEVFWDCRPLSHPTEVQQDFLEKDSDTADDVLYDNQPWCSSSEGRTSSLPSPTTNNNTLQWAGFEHFTVKFYSCPVRCLKEHQKESLSGGPAKKKKMLQKLCDALCSMRTLAFCQLPMLAEYDRFHVLQPLVAAMKEYKSWCVNVRVFCLRLYCCCWLKYVIS